MLFQPLMPVQKTEDGVILFLKVTPKAARNRMGGIGTDQRLKIYVTAVPEDGKANDAVIHFLSEQWRLPKHLFTLIDGAMNHLKKIHIARRRK